MSHETNQNLETKGIMNKMRNNTIVVMYILVFAFVGMIIFSWGMDFLGATSPAQKGIIGTVNDTDIGYEYFNQRLQQQMDSYRAQLGSIPDGSFLTNLNNQLWNEIVNEALVNHVIEEMEIVASNEEVVQEIRYRPLPEIRNNPQFQLETGGFDQAKYEGFLKSDQTGTVLQLEAQARSQIPMKKLFNMIVSSVRVTDEEVVQAYKEQALTADIDYISIDSYTLEDAIAEPTEQEISNYYRLFRKDFSEPETRSLKYVIFSSAPTTQDSVDTRELINEVVAKAKNNEDFAELAKEFSNSPNSDNGGSLGIVTKGSMIEDVDAALFASGIKKDDVIGPIVTSNGTQIFKINEVFGRRSRIDSLNVSNIIINYEASEKTIDKAESDAGYFGYLAEEDGFDKAAENNGYEVLQTLPFARGGFITGFGVNYQISDFATYSNENDQNKGISQPFEVPGGYGVFTVSAINKEHIQSLEDVKPQIVAVLMQKARVEKIEEKMAAIKQTINSGTSFEDAASTNDLKVTSLDGIKFSDSIPEIGRYLKFASPVFALENGKISNVITVNEKVYLVKMKRIDEIDQADYEAQKESIKSNLLMSKRNAAYSSWLKELQDKADIEDLRSFFYRL